MRRRSRRTLAAARAALVAGELGRAEELAARIMDLQGADGPAVVPAHAPAAPLDAEGAPGGGSGLRPLEQAELADIRAKVAEEGQRLDEAHRALCSAATRLAARTELLHGEWLRRNSGRSAAQPPLRSAALTFERLGAEPWAARARSELRATGESSTAPHAGETALALLTPQEVQVVRLAATGLSNRQIAARLFLSHRTVGYHLSNAYPKLGVASRRELSRLRLEADVHAPVSARTPPSAGDGGAAGTGGRLTPAADRRP